MKEPTHWTISRLHDYEKCPAAYSYRYRHGLAGKPHPAAERGTAIHELMEEAVKTGKALKGAALSRFNAYVAELRGYPECIAEGEWAVNNKWTHTQYDDPKMWLRSKLDVVVHDRDYWKVTDWKTGKIYGTNADQMLLYAGLVFERFKPAEVEVELVYLDQRQAIGQTITAADWALAKPEFNTRAKRMLNGKQAFKPTPGDACRWCQYAKSKGGPCHDEA